MQLCIYLVRSHPAFSRSYWCSSLSVFLLYRLQVDFGSGYCQMQVNMHQWPYICRKGVEVVQRRFKEVRSNATRDSVLHIYIPPSCDVRPSSPVSVRAE
jgi:hypothetical protein